MIIFLYICIKNILYILYNCINKRPQDYWVSVLHKRLVGEGVLRVALEGAPSTLRMYAHCSKNATGILARIKEYHLSMHFKNSIPSCKYNKGYKPLQLGKYSFVWNFNGLYPLRYHLCNCLCKIFYVTLTVIPMNSLNISKY